MDYGKMIQIALSEMYQYKYNMVLIFEKDNYVFIRYPKDFYSIRMSISGLIESDEVVLVIKEYAQTQIIKGIRDIYGYLSRNE